MRIFHHEAPSAAAQPNRKISPQSAQRSQGRGAIHRALGKRNQKEFNRREPSATKPQPKAGISRAKAQWENIVISNEERNLSLDPSHSLGMTVTFTL